LEATNSQSAASILSRIFYWTGGHPYLTQKLCLALTEASHEDWADIQADQIVDRLVERLFLSEAGQDDIDLLRMRENIFTNPRRRRLVALYRQVYEGQTIREDEQSPDQDQLKLIGLVHTEKGLLKVRNLIYRQVFNLNWLKTNMPSVNWLQYAAITLIVLALIVTTVIGFLIYNQVQTVIAAQAQPFLDNINSATVPDVRLSSLAGLFRLPGYQDEARRAFYHDLNPEERLALFEQADPHTSGADLITVIQGVYTAPNLQNNEQDNILLQAMAKTMNELVDDPAYPGAVSLELEINQWLNGRDLYKQGEFRRAISSYNLALDLNGNNPGILFDRGLANAAYEQPNKALDDFATVLDLDERWQARVEQTLSSNSQIYDTLWNSQEAYQRLIALIPTPTNTPIPTNTPTPSPTFTASPANTPTPRPPTATPTATPTFTRASIVVPPTSSSGSPATSTPSIASPSGTLTLLAPLSLDEPSYGSTTFQWQWSGSLPADYGFEVRMWKEGAPPAGVHNAVLDNQNGNVKSLGNNIYQLQTDIKDAAGVKGNSGLYQWTVALVKISPKYRDLGIQAPPAQIRFAAPGASGGSGGGGSGGGVGIE
jgi:tetratricopeptide (TPR) repeat protein